jgi:hypothetical protein
MSFIHRKNRYLSCFTTDFFLILILLLYLITAHQINLFLEGAIFLQLVQCEAFHRVYFGSFAELNHTQNDSTLVLKQSKIKSVSVY